MPVSGGVGTKINLTGANLTQVTVARIGLVNLKINNKTDNQMEVEVLTGSVTGKLSVIAGGSTYETTSNFIITGSPQVNAFTPSSGIPGSVVTITGINFPANPDVRFGTSSAAVVTSSSTTEIVCPVPANATTGKINVSGALSAANYTLNVKAVITSISPMQGGVGAEITI
ncbi:MAG TPA: IPT/TIG domain-containing protein, partial [Cyclobacteriaceae bacterium]|nr:IPT/TIG domain-containing protein [Cyclobacteriaceae bacterium]